MRKGDIVVNPWVSKEYNGKLNPLYATIYIGENCSLDYMGRQHHWGHPIHKINEEELTPWEIIGHIDLYEIIKREIGYEADTPQTESTGSPIGDYRDGVGAWQTDCKDCQW